MSTPLAGLTPFDDNTATGQTGRDPAQFGAPQSPVHVVPGDASGQLPAGRQGARTYPVTIEQDQAPQDGASPASGIKDHTPIGHTAPTFRGIEHDPLDYADGSFDLHGTDLGGPGLKDFHVPYPFTPDFTLNESAGGSILDKAPGQLSFGTDVDQGRGVPNPGTFGMWHQFRNWFRDPVPRNYGSVGERPFFGKHPMRLPTYDNDSQYGVAGDTTHGMNLRPVQTALPKPYEQPANPTVDPQTAYQSESPMAWW